VLVATKDHNDRMTPASACRQDWLGTGRMLSILNKEMEEMRDDKIWAPEKTEGTDQRARDNGEGVCGPT
jgi:hypothetical protein